MPEPLVFPGVRSSRFIGYLHGLALLRVVTEQLDPAARGAWSRGAFALTTGATRDELVAFFVERWVPTPVVSPWNGSSGFHADDKAAEVSLRRIEASVEPRLAEIRSTIAVTRAGLAHGGLGERLRAAQKAKPKNPATVKEAKIALLRHLRATLPEPALLWFDAAVVLTGVDVGYPPALGTGGNDGRYDLAVNNAHCLVALFGLDKPQRASVNADLLGSLFSGASTPTLKATVGHLSQAPRANLWDLPLAVEGLLVLAAGTSRRAESGAPVQAAAPFSFMPTTGFASAVAGESARAEQWMPVWQSPAALSEVHSLLREGRSNVGRRRAETGLDVARAAGDLGVARGIGSFERFAILERVGKAHLTLHAGRIEVRERPAVRALRGLDAGNWLSRVLAASSEGTATAKRQAARGLEKAAFAMAARGRPEDVERMLGRLGEIELVLARDGASSIGADGSVLRSIRPPAQPWVDALDHEVAEVRVAVALGSLADGRDAQGLPYLRDLLNGTARAERKEAYSDSQMPLVPTNGSATRRLLALHLRREVDATSAELGGPAFAFGRPASLADLTRLASGTLDVERTMSLVAGLALLDFRGVRMDEPAPGGFVSPALATLALVVHHRTLGTATNPEAWRTPASLIARLGARKVRPALSDAIARIRQAGHPPIATAADLAAGAPDGHGLAIALLARPSVSDLRRALRHLTAPAFSADGNPITHTEQELSS